MRKADILPPSCAVVKKTGNLNFLEPSGPFRASNGTALPLPLPLPLPLRSSHNNCSDILYQYEQDEKFLRIKTTIKLISVKMFWYAISTSTWLPTFRLS